MWHERKISNSFIYTSLTAVFAALAFLSSLFIPLHPLFMLVLGMVLVSATREPRLASGLGGIVLGTGTTGVLIGTLISWIPLGLMLTSTWTMFFICLAAPTAMFLLGFGSAKAFTYVRARFARTTFTAA